MMLPTGPLCYRCRRDIAYHPGICPECFELRPIAYPSTSSYNVLVCAGCANEESVFACSECGREDHPYGASRCARCILKERLTALLTDPETGCVHEALVPLFEELLRARRPQSVITWLTKPPAIGPSLLDRMAHGELAVSHDTFRALPAGRAENYLRDLLTATGILPPYHPPIEQMERWLSTRLAEVSGDDAALIGRYARWHLLRRLRGLAERGPLSKPSIYSARSHINGAIRLSTWATANSTTIAALTQPQLESYLTENPGGRTTQQSFIAWLGRSKENTQVMLPWRGTTPEVVVSDDERWDSIDRLINDDEIALYARIGGLFMLLFAQPLRTIAAMTRDQIIITDAGRVTVTFDTEPVEMPPGLDELIRRYLHKPGTPSIASTDHGWLFPGRYPGSHLVTDVFRSKLVTAGIHPGTSRNAAMFGLAGRIPPPVLADLIGIADHTAVRWAALAARDWSGYIAQRAE
ncbi:hypothetical protein [Nesterenkonia alkaliphila]|uniref:hypothetical protein n=1 Tax=Nesterenkonia alkaliphila TaxID=1463631 RepID=UPI0016664A99|nr:hypothetical protein [Nesterenkonia alkaliphila]